MPQFLPPSSVDAHVKLIGPAASTGAHMHICHISGTSSRDIDKAAPLVREAIAQGLPVSLGAYTYGVAESAIGAKGEWGSTNTSMFLIYTVAPVESVPEPSTLALVAIGLAGIGFSRRKETYEKNN